MKHLTAVRWICESYVRSIWHLKCIKSHAVQGLCKQMFTICNPYITAMAWRNHAMDIGYRGWNIYIHSDNTATAWETIPWEYEKADADQYSFRFHTHTFTYKNIEAGLECVCGTWLKLLSWRVSVSTTAPIPSLPNPKTLRAALTACFSGAHASPLHP